MNTLISIRANILYVNSKQKKTDANNFKKFFELVFLVSNHKYSFTNSKEIIRENNLEDLRCTVHEESLDEFIKVLLQIKDADETELF